MNALQNALQAAFASFALRDFRLLWLVVCLSAAPLIVASSLDLTLGFELNESYLSATWPSTLIVVGGLAIVPFCGVLADRCSRKRLVVAALCASAAALAATGALTLLDAITLDILAALSVALALVAVLLASARDVWVANLVPQRMLPNGLVHSSIAVGFGVLAGTLLLWAIATEWRADFGWKYLIIAAFPLIAAALALRLPSAAPPAALPAAPPTGLLRELRAGIGYLAGDRRLRLLWAFMLLLGACGEGAQQFIDSQILVEFGSLRFGSIELVIGLAAASFALPFALAGLLSGQLAPSLLLSFTVLLAAGCWLGAAATTEDALVVSRFTASTAAGAAVLIAIVLALLNARPQYYGRVLSLLIAALSLGAAVQELALEAGGIWIPAEFDPPAALWTLGAIALGGAVWIWSTWRRTRGLPPEPGSAAEALSPAPPPAAAPAVAASLAAVAVSRGQHTPDNETPYQ